MNYTNTRTHPECTPWCHVTWYICVRPTEPANVSYLRTVVNTDHFMTTLDVTTGPHLKVSVKPALTTSAMPESAATASELSPRDPVSMGSWEFWGANTAWLSIL